MILQRARRQAAAGLRRRTEGARLALRGRPLRGDCAACCARGKAGETYNIGGGTRKPNIEIVQTICDLLDEMLPQGIRSRHGVN